MTVGKRIGVCEILSSDAVWLAAVGVVKVNVNDGEGENDGNDVTTTEGQEPLLNDDKDDTVDEITLFVKFKFDSGIYVDEEAFCKGIFLITVEFDELDVTTDVGTSDADSVE